MSLNVECHFFNLRKQTLLTPYLSFVASTPIQLTPEEKSYYEPLFRQCDPKNQGFIPGETAKDILIKSNLPPVILGQIWQLADPQNNGYLDKNGFFLALRIIGKVQSGNQLTASIGETRK